MKVLIYADLHLYNHHKLLINSETALNTLTYIKDYALEHDIKTVISAGDFFHTKARAYAPHVIQAWLRIKDMHKSGLEHYMLIGNHDMSNPNNSMNSILFVFSDYAKIIPDYYFLDVGNTRIHFLSFTNIAFENFIIAENKKNVLITHLDIIGFTTPNGYIASSGFRIDSFENFDLVLSGHYHKHQTIKNITYIGSTYQTSFSEREQVHGFVVLDTNDLSWELIECKDTPKYKVIEINSVNDVSGKDVDNNFVKIRLLNDKVNKLKLKEVLLEKGAISADVIPFESVVEIKKYYDKELSDEPGDIATAYINNLTNLKKNKRIELMKYFTKIEEASSNIADYDI